MASEDLFHRVGYLTQGSSGPGRVYCQFKQIAGFVFRGFGDGCQASLDLEVVTLGAKLVQPGDLRFTHGGVVNFEELHWLLFLQAILVHTHDAVFT